MASPASATSIVVSCGAGIANSEADEDGEADADSEGAAEGDAARSSPGGEPFEQASSTSDNDATTQLRTPLCRPNRSPTPTHRFG